VLVIVADNTGDKDITDDSRSVPNVDRKPRKTAVAPKNKPADCGIGGRQNGAAYSWGRSAPPGAQAAAVAHSKSGETIAWFAPEISTPLFFTNPAATRN
jgi:hypothetical protein